MEEVLVRFSALAEVAFGEDVKICGSVPTLGSWSISGAAPMTWTEGGRWVSELPLPCGVCVELKLVVSSQNGQRWIGAGAGGDENVRLQTSLGRSGAQPSRFQNAGALPFALEVVDLGEPDTRGPSGPDSPSQGGGGAPCLGGGQMVPAGQQLAPVSQVPAAPDAPHVVAAQLAGEAASHGVPVTYTTTTTTTTVVTMHAPEGDARGHPASAPRAMGPQIQYAQPHGAPQQRQPHATEGGASGQPRVVEIEDDDTSSEDCRRSAAAAEAVAAARARNAGLPRIGCTPLAWRRPGASDVRIAGSWDGWVRQLALEPLPQGGFGIILALPRGDYECKFIVDGDWMSSEELETIGKHGNNTFSVDDVLIMPVMPATTLQLQDGCDKAGATAIVLA